MDTGHLWENFLIIERMKKIQYAGKITNNFFWRNYADAEVDFIEIDDMGKINAFEFKWQKSKVKTPKVFRENYGVEVSLVNNDNYLDFII